jgi:LPXTG-motif cell wall-anchored protein
MLKLTRSLPLAIIGGVALSLLATSAATAAASPTATVTPTDISAANVNGGGWFPDIDAGHDTGVVQIANRAAGEAPSLDLHLVHTDDNATLQYRYLTPDMPTDSSTGDFPVLHQLLSNASYTFSGSHVNFQLGIYFKPNNEAAYGPAGTVRACASAGIDSPSTWCFATIKYEPGISPSSFTTIDVSDGFDQGYFAPGGITGSGPQQAGWWRSKQIGQYGPQGSPDNVSLNDMLSQISDLKVYGIGVSIGQDIGTPESWVRDVSFGGATYDFGPTAAPAAAPGLPDSSAVEDYVETHGVTTDFTPAPDATESSNSDLSQFDPTKPLSGDLPWAGDGDTYVDVYAYSTAKYVGTFPVVDGKVVIDSADLSFLSTGAHHLVFVGQQTSSLLVANLTVVAAAAGATLAFTGENAAPALALGGALIVFGGVLFVMRRRRNGMHSSRVR